MQYCQHLSRGQRIVRDIATPQSSKRIHPSEEMNKRAIYQSLSSELVGRGSQSGQCRCLQKDTIHRHDGNIVNKQYHKFLYSGQAIQLLTVTGDIKRYTGLVVALLQTRVDLCNSLLVDETYPREIIA
jgi:hypothetical protein